MPSIADVYDECLRVLEPAGVVSVIDPRDLPTPGAALLEVLNAAIGRLREALRGRDVRVRASEPGYQAQLLLARALACRGRASSRYTEAYAAASAAAECSPLRAPAFVARGQVSFLRGTHVRRWMARAVADFTRALRCAPGDVAARFGRALCHEVPALADLEAAELLRLDGSGPRAQQALVAAEDALAAAVADLDAILQRGPDEGLALLHRAGCLARLGELARARADLDRAIELGAGGFRSGPAAAGDRLARAHVERARIAAALGDPAAALADLDRAEELGASGLAPAARRRRAELAIVSGRPATAVRDLSALIEASPNAELLRQRAGAYFTLGRFDLARADASRILAVDERDAEARLLRGRCAAALGSWQSAMVDLDALLVLGSAYHFLGERGLAEPALHQARALGSSTAADRINRWYGPDR